MLARHGGRGADGQRGVSPGRVRLGCGVEGPGSFPVGSDALLEAGYDAELTEVPGGNLDPLTPGSDSYETYVSVVVDTAAQG